MRKRWKRGLQGIFPSHEVSEHGALTRSMAEHPPAILLLDLPLPGLRGVADILALRRLSPATKIVVLTSTPTEKEGTFALTAGASGYCGRNISPSLLEKAVRVIQKGELWVGRKLTHHLIGELADLTNLLKKASASDREGRLDKLTSREREIVKLLVGGASNKEIARGLNITERTVKTHLTAVFRKLGVSGRLRLALLVKGTGSGQADSPGM